MTHQMSAQEPPDDRPPLGERYDVGGGRRVMLYHAGSGTPAVVVEAGAGAYGLDYLSLGELIAQHTTCVLYDRAGRGWSDPAAEPQGAAEMVADLHAALRAAAVPGPYLLLGHSLGAVLVRAFAQRYPDEVAGLVLLDPATERWPPAPGAGMEAAVRGMIAQMRDTPDLWRQLYPELFADWARLPADVREPLIARHLQPPFDEAGLLDMLLATGVQDDVARGPALPRVPITVVTATRAVASPGQTLEQAQAVSREKLAAHRELVESLPGAEHVVLDDVGHRLQAERPDLVVDAVLATLRRVAP